MKKSQTLHPGAQNPHPGPLPTGPYKNRIRILGRFIYFNVIVCFYRVETIVY